jgi:hypothetical protein
MTYTPTVYDWRYTVQPRSQIFMAGGRALDGGMTVGGVSVESPEPGGRAELRLEFDQIANADANLDASWLASRLLNNAVFRIRLFSPSVQLLSDAALGGSTYSGTTWSNSLGWSAAPWAFDPQSPLTTGAAKGESVVRYNDSGYGRVLRVGHVVGFHVDGYDFAHMVTDISYPTTNRTDVTVYPPFRRAVTNDMYIKFRQTMTVTCVNAREAVGNFMYGTTMGFTAPLQFVEALV